MIISFKAIIFSTIGLIAYNTKAQIKQDTSMLVNGVCNMCKQVIEESSLIDGVHAANWNPQTKILQLTYYPEKTSLEAISVSINKSGYDTEFSTADEEAYQNLPQCCHYRDPEVIRDHQER